MSRRLDFPEVRRLRNARGRPPRSRAGYHRIRLLAKAIPVLPCERTGIESRQATGMQSTFTPIHVPAHPSQAICERIARYSAAIGLMFVLGLRPGPRPRAQRCRWCFPRRSPSTRRVTSSSPRRRPGCSGTLCRWGDDDGGRQWGAGIRGRQWPGHRCRTGLAYWGWRWMRRATSTSRTATTIACARLRLQPA